MKKTRCILVLMLLIAYSASSQTTYFSFYYYGNSPECPSQLNDNWKISHGTPGYGNPYGQNHYAYIKFIGGKDDNWNTKTEGAYISYNFSPLNTYNISISHAHDSGSVVGIDIYASSGLSENITSSCQEGEVPYISTKQLIHRENWVYDGPTGFFSEIYISNFSPSNSFSQFWIQSYASSSERNSKGSFLINSIYITDNGKFDTNPPTKPTNLRATSINSNSITVTWNASTDNTGVKGYQIYKNGTYIGNSTSPNYTLRNLTSCTNYTIGVRAFDKYENFSETTTITAKTISDISADISLNGNIDLLSYQENIYSVKATNSIKLSPGFKVVAQNSKSFNARITEGCSNTRNINDDDIEYIYSDNTDLSPEDNKLTHSKSNQVEVTYNINLIEYINSEMFIYPNPTKGIFNIKIEEIKDRLEYSIYNSLGSLIHTENIVNNETHVDISNQPPGIYYIKIFNGQEIINEKIIKE